MAPPESPAAAYSHPLYASAMAAIGEPLALPRCGGHVVRRTIPGTALADAVGPYPMFTCREWSGLADDLADLRGVVSVVLVADPLGDPDPSFLAAAFPDLARPYKRHYVADLAVPPERRISAHHQRSLRRIPADLRTEQLSDPAARLDDWTAMYGQLVRRHDIRGAAAFSRASFEIQFRVPGLRAWRASIGGETVGMVVWYVAGTDAWYHLTATSEAGYRATCAYALLRHALDDLAAEGVTRADLGGAAGLVDDESDGLAAFKRGWSTGTVDAWLCGRVLDRAAYDRLAAGHGADDGTYFPVYRRTAATAAAVPSSPSMSAPPASPGPDR